MEVLVCYGTMVCRETGLKNGVQWRERLARGQLVSRRCSVVAISREGISSYRLNGDGENNNEDRG